MIKTAKRDITVILVVSFISAALYIALEGTIMDYGREPSNPAASEIPACACHSVWNIGFDLKTAAEAAATFILMYGSLIVYDKTGNSWGNIVIFFVVWNAL